MAWAGTRVNLTTKWWYGYSEKLLIIIGVLNLLSLLGFANLISSLISFKMLATKIGKGLSELTIFCFSLLWGGGGVVSWCWRRVKSPSGVIKKIEKTPNNTNLAPSSIQKHWAMADFPSKLFLFSTPWLRNFGKNNRYHSAIIWNIPISLMVNILRGN